MKVIKIQGTTGDSTILIGESLRDLGRYIPVEKAVIITDTNVRHYYGKDFPSYEVIEIGTGEKIKNLDTVQTVLSVLEEVLFVILPVLLHQPTCAGSGSGLSPQRSYHRSMPVSVGRTV